MIRITCAKDGFRRGGIAHPLGTTEYPDTTFTEAQLAQLSTEPMLQVVITADEPEKKGPNPDKTTKTKPNS